MSGTDSAPAPRAAHNGLRAHVRRSAAGCWHALAFSGLLLLGLGPLLAALLVPVEIQQVALWLAGTHPAGPVLTQGTGAMPAVLILCTVVYLRWLADTTRRLAGRWCGVHIARPYRPAPRQPGIRRRVSWLVTDPATWRDLLWVAVNAVAGTVIVLVPAAMVVYGLTFALLPALGVPAWNLPYVGMAVIRGAGGIPLGLALIAAGLWAAPRVLPGYCLLGRRVLGPTRRSQLSVQLEHLARTRSDTVGAGAAEMRRIERDLHDGAQARLVAMGMTLDAIGQHLDTNPAAARALLADAKASSVRALSELRDLVRGIHPPVLADRGLAEATRALALDCPLRVHASSELDGRPPAPVESAAYFAVSELLTNASKHAGAREAWIELRHEAGHLRISVGDDGRGGADPAGGTGLRGIERRLAAFDGVLAVSSPDGGPTVVSLEIPCALS